MQQLGIFPSTKITKQERLPLSKYPQLFRKFDIGIVPLNDIPFNHAKSTIKGLEYASAGIPFVASYSPEYDLLEKQGVGRVAKSSEEWVGHLEDLMSAKTRKYEREKNYEEVRALHTMKVRGKKWNEVFDEILDS
jgi:glycosyltransferase involved in cell wall biosynthesis